MSVWSVEQSDHYDVIYTQYIHTYIYFYVLKMKFPICSFLALFWQEQHTRSSFSINSASGHWRPTSDCGARVVFVSWAPGESPKMVTQQTQRWRMEWKKRKTPVYSWQDIFSILLPPFFYGALFLILVFLPSRKLVGLVLRDILVCNYHVRLGELLVMAFSVCKTLLQTGFKTHLNEKRTLKTHWWPWSSYN